MASFMATSGPESDRMFLAEMLPHKASGLPSAHRAKPHLQIATLAEMAHSIFVSQALEIGELREQLIREFATVTTFP